MDSLDREARASRVEDGILLIRNWCALVMAKEHSQYVMSGVV